MSKRREKSPIKLHTFSFLDLHKKYCKPKPWNENLIHNWIVLLLKLKKVKTNQFQQVLKVKPLLETKHVTRLFNYESLKFFLNVYLLFAMQTIVVNIYLLSSTSSEQGSKNGQVSN